MIYLISHCYTMLSHYHYCGLLDCRYREMKEGTMGVLAMVFIFTMACPTCSNGKEEVDHDELQQGFFEVDYLLQVEIIEKTLPEARRTHGLTPYLEVPYS